jgi:hypothetical protein
MARLKTFWRSFTLLQKTSVTQEHNMRVTENSFIHIDSSKKSVIHIDWAAWPTCMSEFFQRPHVVLLRHACFFFNSAGFYLIGQLRKICHCHCFSMMQICQIFLNWRNLNRWTYELCHKRSLILLKLCVARLVELLLIFDKMKNLFSLPENCLEGPLAKNIQTWKTLYTVYIIK